jgi:3-(3-hydroxy-phenyl)propionate hydroxylase
MSPILTAESADMASLRDERDRVVVVGAGPAGLVVARGLAGAGIPVTVLEAFSDIPDDLRASTFHPATLDLLDQFGVTEKLIAQGLVCPNWQFRDRKKGVVATFDLGILADDTKFPYRVQCEQWKLTRLLREELATNPDVKIVYGARALSASQTADHATVTVEYETGEREDFTGRWLVGADGARSAVRKSIDVKFEGITIPELYLSVSTTFRFEQAIPDLANIAYISDPEEWLVLLRTPTLWRALFPADPSEPDEVMTSNTRLQERLNSVIARDEPYEVIHSTAYRVQERVVDRYVVGRIILAGDAAHLNNPLGGMGMNGGIQDAMNLWDKLVQVWQGGDTSLLGRYERQRRKVAIETVQQTALKNRAMLNERDEAKRQIYHDEMRAIADDPKKAYAYVLRSSMIQSLRDLEQVA